MNDALAATTQRHRPAPPSSAAPETEGGMATGANVTHEELQAAFFPLGEWPDKDTRERIDFIIDEGLQAAPELIRMGLPQTLRDGTYPILELGDAAPTAGLSLTTLSGTTVQMTELFAQDAAAGKLTLLNFGSYT